MKQDTAAHAVPPQKTPTLNGHGARQVLDGVIYLELEANIASKRVYLTFLPNASDHPVDISLSGCSLQVDMPLSRPCFPR